jgi:crotonobetainyl-CoA:carnitine CoA-transferase CaiB-like acyl-CoA transferase
MWPTVASAAGAPVEHVLAMADAPEDHLGPRGMFVLVEHLSTRLRGRQRASV